MRHTPPRLLRLQTTFHVIQKAGANDDSFTMPFDYFLLLIFAAERF